MHVSYLQQKLLAFISKFHFRNKIKLINKHLSFSVTLAIIQLGSVVHFGHDLACAALMFDRHYVTFLYDIYIVPCSFVTKSSYMTVKIQQ